MDKICIVKLRKELTNTVSADSDYRQVHPAVADSPGNGHSLSDARDRCRPDMTTVSSGNPDGTDAADRAVSLSLTPEQVRALQLHPCMASLRDSASAQTIAAFRCGDEALVIKLELPAMPPLRLLKPEEVTQMLRISRSCLNRMLRKGQLKNYKFGRLRRIMLDDILSYLEAHRASDPCTQRSDREMVSSKGMAQQCKIKEG
jgi:excisionase family DNA binding protein